MFQSCFLDNQPSNRAKTTQHSKRNKNEINKLDVFLKIAEEKKRKWKTSKHPPKTQIVKESAEI